VVPPVPGQALVRQRTLIDSGFDYVRVADWLGHEDVNMLRREYEHNARLHESLYGRHWMDRIGRRSKPESTNARKTPRRFQE
jgi:hypothetical protein